MSTLSTNSSSLRYRGSDLVIGLTCLNFTLLLGVCYLIYGVSESWWVGTVITYAPRLPFVIPSIGLLIVSLFRSREFAGINLISTMIGLFPVMGLIIPNGSILDQSLPTERHSSLKIVSCNVQEFRPDFSKVLEEIVVINPDIVALQEALHTDELLESHFHDWHKVHIGNFWIGSRYPLKPIASCEVSQFGGRLAGIVVEIETPAGAITVANVHQMTARRGLTELNRRSLIDGDGTKELESFESERYLESLDLRAAINAARGEQPLIVCGDFNTPVSSSLFQKHWGDLQSSFDIAGFGFGYTAPCKGNRFWPHNSPWARIDHILCSNEWTVSHAEIGHSDGSDHRLISATLTSNSAAPGSTPLKSQ